MNKQMSINKKRRNQNHSSSSSNSEVERILTKSCFFNFLSSSHKGIFPAIQRSIKGIVLMLMTIFIVLCPRCSSENIIKEDIIKNKISSKQRFRCKDCNKKFSDSALKFKTYPAKAILDAISYYNKGLSLNEVCKEINKRYKIKVSKSSVGNWINEFKELCSYNRIRKNYKLKEDIISEKIFAHLQTYVYRYHKGKIQLFVNEYFSKIKDYLVDITTYCPDELFKSNNTVRCSSLKLKNNVEVTEKYNSACKLASLALKAASNNHKRHEIVQKFMLANDTSTLATELPVYLYNKEIKKSKFLSNLIKDKKAMTGHIDLLQIRFGRLYVLDYKPNASKENKEKVISQLFMYALALSERTGVWLRNIRCAWFDDKAYYEFDPNSIVLSSGGIADSELKKYLSDDSASSYYTDIKFHKKWVKNQSLPAKIILTKSSVVNTLTNDCSLRCGSFDQIAELKANANARKSASSGSEIADFAFSRKSSYSEDLKKSIDSSTSFCLISNCCSESFDLNKHSSLCSFNSDFMNSGAINSHLIDANKYADIEYGFIIENKELLSNTSLILDYLYSSLFSGDIEFNNFSLISGETSLSNCLNLPFFALLPNSTDHLISSCSSLDSSLFNSLSLVSNSFLVNSDQFTQASSFISDLTLSGIANVTVAIYNSPLSTICSNFFNCSTLRIIMLLNTSDHLIPGCLSNLFFNSSGIDNVTVAIFVPPNNYVNRHKYVDVFKPFCSELKKYQSNDSASSYYTDIKFHEKYIKEKNNSELLISSEHKAHDEIKSNNLSLVDPIMMIKVLKNNTISLDSENKNKTSNTNSLKITQVMPKVLEPFINSSRIGCYDLLYLLSDSNCKSSIPSSEFIENLLQLRRNIKWEAHSISSNLSNLPKSIRECGPSIMPLIFFTYSSLTSSQSMGSQFISSQNSSSLLDSSSPLMNLSNISFLRAFSLATSDQLTQGNLSISTGILSSKGIVMLTIYNSPLFSSSSNFFNLANFSSIPCFITSGQFTSGILSNLSLSSFDIDTVNRFISTTPNCVDKRKCVDIFKPSDSKEKFESNPTTIKETFEVGVAKQSQHLDPQHQNIGQSHHQDSGRSSTPGFWTISMAMLLWMGLFGLFAASFVGAIAPSNPKIIGIMDDEVMNNAHK